MTSPYAPMPHAPQKPGVIGLGQQLIASPWALLCVLVFGPCALCVVGLFAITLLPFAMVIGGLIAGIMGWQMSARFKGHRGYEGHANKGLALMIGGFAAVVLGALWIFVAWLSPSSGTWSPPAESAPVEGSAPSEEREIMNPTTGS